MMQIGYLLLSLILPIFLEGCCENAVGNPSKTGKAVCRSSAEHHHYRAVQGEIFMMPCTDEQVTWFRITEGREGNEGQSFKCGTEIPTEANHSGNYTFFPGKIFLHLQVVEKIRMPCYEPEESRVTLHIGKGGKVPCPGRTCSDNTNVIWYKGNGCVAEQKRRSCDEDGLLSLCTVNEYDKGVHFCDRKITEQGVTWTFRRAVDVTATPDYEASELIPNIMTPKNGTTEQVELGRPHTLICKVNFPLVNFSPAVRWYTNGNMENMTLLHMGGQQQKKVSSKFMEVTQSASIEDVTTLHLNHTYTCFASNTKGSSSVSVRLKKKIKVKWPSLIGYPIASLLLVGGLGIILHVKWLEVQLIYRLHCQHGKHDEDEKDFDVFLSYVWSPSPAEEEGSLTFSSPSEPDADLEACLSGLEFLNSELGSANQRPLEALLPRVLEDLWGYRLCLMERDMLPGGAYTNDVVRAIQRSQMLICLLSDEYLSNSNAVFVLESGVQTLLQNSTLQLLLIRTSRTSTSLLQPDSPLPSVVQRALKVLPSLDWTSVKPGRPNNSFWKSLRKALPTHRVNLVSFMQSK